VTILYDSLQQLASDITSNQQLNPDLHNVAFQSCSAKSYGEMHNCSLSAYQVQKTFNSVLEYVR